MGCDIMLTDTISFSEFVEFIRTNGAVWASFDGIQLKVLNNVQIIEGETTSLKFDRVGYTNNFILVEDDVKVIYGSDKRYSIHHKKGVMLHVWYEDISTMYLP